MSCRHKDRDPKCEAKKEPDPNHRTQCRLGQAGQIKPQKCLALEISITTQPATGRWRQHSQTGLMPFEILNRAFVFLCRCLAIERAEIFSFARSRIFLVGIQPILAGFQFSDHCCLVALWNEISLLSGEFSVLFFTLSILTVLVRGFAGNVNRNVDPFPSLLSTLTRPP